MKKTSIAGYAEKVPKAVLEENESKASKLAAELQTVTEPQPILRNSSSAPSHWVRLCSYSSTELLLEVFEVLEPLDCFIISIHLVKVYVSPLLLLLVFYPKHTACFCSLELDKVTAPYAFNDFEDGFTIVSNATEDSLQGNRAHWCHFCVLCQTLCWKLFW